MNSKQRRKQRRQRERAIAAELKVMADDPVAFARKYLANAKITPMHPYQRELMNRVLSGKRIKLAR